MRKRPNKYAQKEKEIENDRRRVIERGGKRSKERERGG